MKDRNFKKGAPLKAMTLKVSKININVKIDEYIIVNSIFIMEKFK
jgi:hypothetical protein